MAHHAQQGPGPCGLQALRPNDSQHTYVKSTEPVKRYVRKLFGRYNEDPPCEGNNLSAGGLFPEPAGIMNREVRQF